MGTSLTNTLKLIKPDDNESVNVDHLNQNFDKIDAALPKIVLLNIPEGKTPLVFSGTITTSTGAGGTNRTGKDATDAKGVGGLWIGYQGIPKFEGITAVNITQGNSGSEIFDVGITVIDANPVRVQYRAKRYDSSLAHNYQSMKLHVTIMGW